MARSLALGAATIVAALLTVSGAGGAAGAQTPKRGGTVFVAFSSTEPVCLNWVLSGCQNGLNWHALVENAFQGALELGPHGWRSVLVSGVTLTKKPFTVTYHIRRQAHWSDGVPVTSSDFAFADRIWLKYHRDPDEPMRAQVRRFVVLDAKTFRLEYRSYFQFWHAMPPGPLPRHVLLGQNFSRVWNDALDDPRTGEPIGDGPFLVKHWDQTELVLVRNAHYWGPHPAHIARLVFRFVSDPEAALRSGAVDVVGSNSALEQDAAQGLIEDPAPGVDVLSIPSAGWEHFDLRVARRRALDGRPCSRALDRVALAHAVSAGLPSPLPVVDNTIYLPNQSEYRPNWRVYRYRPTLARHLLEQAGCRLGTSAIYVCGGRPLSLRFVTTTGNDRRARTLQIVHAQLARIGVDVVPAYTPLTAFLQTVLQTGDFDLALFAWSHGMPELVESEYGCGYDTNYTGYCSRLVTSDANQLDSIVDPARKEEVANRVDRRLVQDVPVLPLFQEPYFVAHRDTVHGIVPSDFNAPTWNAEDWWLER